MDNLVFATIKEVHYFGFDERVAGKGANVVASLLKKMVDMQITRLLAMGGKLKHLILWCDSTRGQTWNTVIMRVIQDMLLKGSPVYVEGLERIDVKCCVMGHS